MAEEIVNRVAKSNLITIDLESYYDQGERVVLDIKDQLYQGMILREKEFRAFVKDHDWSVYKDKNVAITCSAEAIVPTWAYMLIATRLAPVARYYVMGDLDDLERSLFQQALSEIDPEAYDDARVVIKGCSDRPVPENAYVELVRLLAPKVKSIMYGEPCSTVPVFKRR